MNLARVLAWIFAASLLFRFCYVFETNPVYNIFSDPQRHWDSAKTFWTPGLFGSADPIMYQAWLSFVRFVTRDHLLGLAFFSGLLSVIMPLCWLGTLRYLVPRNWALVGANLISWSPSLIMIYSYFMNETLLITLISAAVWLSFRAFSHGTFGSYAWAAVFWVLASYTRMTALPPAGIFLALLCLSSRRQFFARGLFGAALYGIMLIPACWHSMYRLNFCEPFGLSYVNAIHNAAQTNTIKFDVVEQGHWGFGMCTINNEPLAPFSRWRGAETGNFTFHIDPANGRADWKKALEEARNRPGRPYGFWEKKGVTAVRFFLDPSWPDNNREWRMGRLAMLNRWLVLPLVVAVAALSWRYRRAPLKIMLLPALSLFMVALMLLQNSYVVEGRYRKPFEPMLIASCVILLYERRKRQRSKDEAEA